MTITIIALMALFAIFASESWDTWRAILKAARALPLGHTERARLRDLTGRQMFPARPVRELWLILGRRAGKSIIAALMAVWATCCCTYALAPGEVGVFMVIASDRRQARVVKRYIAGLLRAIAPLASLIERETADAIWLTNGLCIEIHTCSFRTLRGYTVIGAVVDEVAFWTVDDSANPDREVLVALRAAMASIPEAMLIALTTPYARRGEAWRMFKTYYGRDDAEAVLVVNASTQTMNPTIEPEIIAEAYAQDPAAAAAEYGAQFRADIESFITVEVIDSATVSGRHELPPVLGVTYYTFEDPSGGSADSFTMAIAHHQSRDDGHVVVLDVVREVRPPFSPESTVAEFAALAKRYSVERVTGDRYAGEWPREQFRKHGIEYVPSEHAKSDLYRDVLPLLNSGRVELLDDARLRTQLVGLERRTARGGKDSIDHGPGGHDDLANAVVGAIVLAAHAAGGVDTSITSFAAFAEHGIARDDRPVSPVPSGVGIAGGVQKPGFSDGASLATPADAGFCGGSRWRL